MAAESPQTPNNVSPNEPITIDGETTLEEVVTENQVVVVDFYADWCGPCRMMEPVIKEIAATTPAAVAKVDVDANQQLAAGYAVRGVPTLLVFAGGEQVERLVGARTDEQLRGLIDQYLPQ